MAEKNLFYYMDGLGNLPDHAMFSLTIENNILHLNHVIPHLLGKGKVLQEYKINAENILAFDIVNVADLQNKSVIGRGAAGAFLFGPVGAVLGGMSGASKQKIKSTLAISFLPSLGGDPKTIVFDAEPPSWGSKNKLSIAKMKKQLTQITKSQEVMAHLGQTVNADGSISL